MPKIIEGSAFTPSSRYGGGGTREAFAGKGKSMAYGKNMAPKGARAPKKPRKV